MPNKVEDKDIAIKIEHDANGKNYWIDMDTIVADFKIPVEELQDILKKSHTIIMNNEGKLTTRELYRKNTPFFGKLIDTLKNKID